MGTGQGSARRSRSGGTGAAGTGNPRALALRTIRRVVEEGAYSNLALAGELERSPLPDPDRRFAADIVYGTLRKLLVLDRELARASARPLRAVDPEPLCILRMGAYQLLFTRVPPHAAVGETVELAGPRTRGFVNAVLRKLSAGQAEPPHGESDQAVSARTGLTPWAVTELRRLLPDGEVEEAAAALASPAPLSLRTNTCRTSPHVLRDLLESAKYTVAPGTHHPDVLRVPSAVPSKLPGYAEGWFAVQDEASVLVAEAVQVEPGDRVLDACAAPGGKAAHLACRVGERGLVVGADLHEGRARLVRAGARRLGVRVAALVQDASHPALRGTFDAVLVDAPCSGLGAARRRPELLWRPARTDLARLARLQVAILRGVADLVKPGGRMVYSVCTFTRAETDAAVRAFLSRCPDFEQAEVPGPDGRATSHRLWPHVHGTDAMFVAAFTRSASDLPYDAPMAPGSSSPGSLPRSSL